MMMRESITTSMRVLCHHVSLFCRHDLPAMSFACPFSLLSPFPLAFDVGAYAIAATSDGWWFTGAVI